jgi:GDP-L-fucose synthase
MVGSAISRRLISLGYNNLVFTPRSDYDLTNQCVVAEFIAREKPDYVFLAAAMVGGIMANNTLRAQFIYENIMIQSNIIHHSYLNGVKKLLFLGSSCIYPKNCPQPILEDYLLTGELEYTNEPYAIAKIAGLKMCEAYNMQYGTNFISVMPTNLYGPNDNYNLDTSHVLPALIRKFHLGKCLMDNDMPSIRENIDRYLLKGADKDSSEELIIESLSRYGIRYINPHDRSSGVVIELWGSGKPLREFLHVDDLAAACVHLVMHGDQPGKTPDNKATLPNNHFNIGSGEENSISDLATLIAGIVGFTGEIRWDSSKPDGTFRKFLDSTRIKTLGWKPAITLEEGIAMVYLKISE